MSTITQRSPRPASTEPTGSEPAHSVSESRKIEVYSDPNSNGYLSRVDYAAGEHVPVVVDGAMIGTVAVADILP
jgi:hypothetical protein